MMNSKVLNPLQMRQMCKTMRLMSRIMKTKTIRPMIQATMNPAINQLKVFSIVNIMRPARQTPGFSKAKLIITKNALQLAEPIQLLIHMQWWSKFQVHLIIIKEVPIANFAVFRLGIHKTFTEATVQHITLNLFFLFLIPTLIQYYDSRIPFLNQTIIVSEGSVKLDIVAEIRSKTRVTRYSTVIMILELPFSKLGKTTQKYKMNFVRNTMQLNSCGSTGGFVHVVFLSYLLFEFFILIIRNCKIISPWEELITIIINLQPAMTEDQLQKSINSFQQELKESIKMMSVDQSNSQTLTFLKKLQQKVRFFIEGNKIVFDHALFDIQVTIYNNLACLYQKRGKYQPALYYLSITQKLENSYIKKFYQNEDIPTDFLQQISTTFSNLCVVHLKLGHKQEALLNIQCALNILLENEKLMQHQSLAFQLYNYTIMLQSDFKYRKALDAAEKGLKIAEVQGVNGMKGKYKDSIEILKQKIRKEEERNEKMVKKYQLGETGIIKSRRDIETHQIKYRIKKKYSETKDPHTSFRSQNQSQSRKEKIEGLAVTYGESMKKQVFKLKNIANPQKINKRLLKPQSESIVVDGDINNKSNKKYSFYQNFVQEFAGNRIEKVKQNKMNFHSKISKKVYKSRAAQKNENDSKNLQKVIEQMYLSK